MGCAGGDRRGVGEKRRPRVVTPSGPLGGGRGPARVFLGNSCQETTDGRRRNGRIDVPGRIRRSHHGPRARSHEIPSLSLPSLSPGGVRHHETRTRRQRCGPGSSRVDPVRTRRKCRGNRARPQVSWPPLSGGAPASQFFKHASCTRTSRAFPAGLPGEILGSARFRVCGPGASTIHNPQ